jgi:hypothetical protein
VSRLFSRPRPDGIDERSTAAGIFETFSQVERQQSLHDETLGTIRQQLAVRHRFVLSKDDWSAIESTLDAFATFGPKTHYLSTGTDTYGGGRLPTYAELMTATDEGGVPPVGSYVRGGERPCRPSISRTSSCTWNAR